ncbi:MAG TPA: GntR family transcriptional regulator [Candidatus Tumulicola sp.]
MIAAPLERESTATRVAAVLRDRIVEGTLAPGSRIVELEVSRELGVSRSPVREALLKLAEEGLAAIVPYRGAIVSPLRRERFVELTEFRIALERFALDRLTERADAGSLDALRARVAAMRRALHAGNRRSAVDEDLALHRAIVAMAGNALLERAYDGLLAQIRLYIHVTSARYQRSEELAEEHEALLAAIAARDFPRARAVLDAHILHGFSEAVFEEDSGAPGPVPETSQTAIGKNARRYRPV